MHKKFLPLLLLVTGSTVPTHSGYGENFSAYERAAQHQQYPTKGIIRPKLVNRSKDESGILDNSSDVIRSDVSRMLVPRP